jgi:hypothetical protein
MKPSRPRFTAADAERAHAEWGANCGPGAIAAIAGLSLDELRPSLGDFEAKGYANPTLMFQTLDRLGLKWGRRRDKDWPDWGLVRIQWHGPWTKPGVPPRVAYRHTHWVASCRHVPEGGALEIGVFDINCMASHGWVALDDWRDKVVPWLTEDMPRADGQWHITHALEVERAAPA